VEWVETTGRTLDEAKEAALDQLGVDEADVEFAVLEEPTLGLFGRVRSEARVRARVMPTSARPRDGGRERRRRRSRPADTGPDTSGSDASAAGELGRYAGSETREAVMVEQRATGAGAGLEGSPTLADQAEDGRQFLVGLLEAFGLPGTVSVSMRNTPAGAEPVAELVVTGADLGLLIGPTGTTLNAVQELVRLAVPRPAAGLPGRLLVDVGGYRAKRTAALERFVQETAARVVATGTRVALEPMHAADRKVVHDTVNAIAGVQSVSEGEEPRRRVVLESAGA